MWRKEFENYHGHTMISNCLTQTDSNAFMKDYAEAYKERGQKTLCVLEHGNRSDAWAQFEYGQKYDLKPIVAAETYFVPDRNPELKDNRNFHLVLIAKNQEGFYELNEAMSEANMTGFYMKPRVDFDILSRLNYKNFLCTTACVAGPVKPDDCENLILPLKEIFRENFYLEVQHHPQDVQVRHNRKVLRLYQKYGIPLIYATDSHYIRKEDKILRTELLRSSGITYEYEDEFDLYLPTAEEAYNMLVQQNVLSNAQIEEAMENTLQLREFEGVSFDNDRKFPISRPELTLEQREMLYKKMVCNGYIQKAGMPSKEEAADIHSELDIVVDTHSADYFIGLHDMIERGLEKGGILTTTGRGSMSGFVSNYALGFTSINRLHCPVRMYKERFLSKDKLKAGLPDIDSNTANTEAFEEAGREIFGQHGCYPMIAYGTCKTKSAFKLLARARNLDPQLANEVSKQIGDYELAVKHEQENHEDDPDYNVDDDIHIEDYVDKQYLDLIEDSKQYKGIITSWSPHPCAHLIYHKDLRREIGVVRTKGKDSEGNNILCVYIDGATADRYNWVKIDLLKVDIVKIIRDTYKLVGKEVPSSTDLLKEVDQHPEVWKLFEKGYTLGLNQTERDKTTEKVKRFKPKNVVELAAFIAAIRPGAKSLVDDLVERNLHTYKIDSMDKLLRLDGSTGTTASSSFLLYDEQILTLAGKASIPPEEAYVLIKSIKKKKHDKVAAFKEQFITGFKDYLINQEGVDKALAEQTAGSVWTVILNSASYLFQWNHCVVTHNRKDSEPIHVGCAQIAC